MIRERLEGLLETKVMGRCLQTMESVDSTNLQIKALGESGYPEGTVVTAEEQTAGRGRRGRRWESPRGEALYMSVLLRPRIETNQASMLTLIGALAVRRAVEDAAGLQSLIKWPNDLVYQGKKICGILTEMYAGAEGIRYIVLGIGVNANQKEFPKELEDRAVSLNMILGREVDRECLAASILNRLEEYYLPFTAQGSLDFVRDEYNQNLVSLQAGVRVLSPGQEYEGVALGIDGRGNLLVRTEAGEIEKVSSGEVSVRGIYGYV